MVLMMKMILMRVSKYIGFSKEKMKKLFNEPKTE